MHLYYHVGEDGKRVYTLKKKDPEGKPTLSAHPGSFCLPSLHIPLIPGRNAWLPVAAPRGLNAELTGAQLVARGNFGMQRCSWARAPVPS